MTIARTEAELVAWLRDAVADILEVDAADVDPHRPLTELGLGSRDAVGLVGELEDHLDRDLDATMVWKTPTIAALAAALAHLDDAEQPAPAASHDTASGTPSGEQAADDPVVVVGIGCRFPGATGPAAFWTLLAEGTDAVSEVPEGRWEQFTGSSPGARRAAAGLTRQGGFLDDVATFDADHFGLSAREAELMDPQQRMLLEVAVEALEDAGIAPSALRGTDTGVYVGMSANEYGFLTMSDLATVDAWTSTGTALSIAANRLSYLLDLRGPSMTSDTACSSSLVALHQAVRALEAGDITAALVGGVNLLLTPAVTLTFDHAGALSKTGGCKPFSADADGIVRAEGAGVIVVKRLSAALAAGDRVLAVVRGTAVNSDGRSNGLTAPNPLAQEAVLRQAYAKAGVDPASVDYVEAHGTGTLLGDPIEASALGEVLGKGRDSAAPLLLGSVKSNLGHLESAAGIAGLIKVVLAMRHGVLPPSIRFSAPNPHIRFDDWRLGVVTEPRPWPRYGGLARAGVSGFGFGGTNAHVVLEEWPGDATAAGTVAVDPETGEIPTQEARPLEPVTLLLSAATPDRVKAQALALAEQLEAGEVTPRDAAHTLARHRERGAATTVVAARGSDNLAGALRRFVAGEKAESHTGLVKQVPDVVAARQHRGSARGAVWVFSGIGSQWAGMGRRLLAEEPAFGLAIDELDPLFQAEAGFSLRKLIESGEQFASLYQIQLATFGTQLALAQLWRSYGAEPAAVIGNSMGEISAAVVAGGLSVADAVKVMAVRTALMDEGEARGTGGMAVVQLSAEEHERLAERFPDVTVCVYSSPGTLTVGSSVAEQLNEYVAHVEQLGRTAWPLPIRGAAHSAAMDEGLEPFRQGITGITPLNPTVPFYSTAFDDPRRQPVFDAEYWVTNVRQPVRFSQGIAAAAEDGHVAFLEVSPHPVAAVPVKQSIAGRVGTEQLVLPTLRRDTDDTVTFRAHALALQAAGLLPAGTEVVPRAELAELRHAWLHRRHWVDAPIGGGPGGGGIGGHPLLGLEIDLPEGGRFLWRADVGTATVPWTADHEVYGHPVLPLAAYAETALSAGREALAPDEGPEAVVVTDMRLHSMMVLGEHTEVTTSVTLEGEDRARVEIHARPPGAARRTPMELHASAVVSRAAGGPETDVVLDLPLVEDGEPVDLYATMRALGLGYGPSFAGVTDARVGAGGVAAARAALPEIVAPDAHYSVHPVLLDVCLQTLGVSAVGLASSLAGSLEDAAARAYLPVGIGEVRVLADPSAGGLVTGRLRLDDETGESLSGSLRVVADDGTVLLEVRDVRLRRIDRDELPEAPAFEGDEGDDWPGPAALRAMSPGAARQLVADRLRSRMAWVLGVEGATIDPTMPLSAMGIDSLTAVRAKNAMEHDAGIIVPARVLLQGGSLVDLEAFLAGELGLDVAPAPDFGPVPERSLHVDGRDATERWLATVWQEVLGVGSPGVTTPWAELGAGDEELGRALNLVKERLEGQPGAGEDVHGPFPDADFLAAPTIEAQSDLVRPRLEEAHGSPIRVLAPGDPEAANNSRPPLFVFHPAGGTTSVYFSLAQGLDPEQTVYGFERLDEPTVDAKVEGYVRMIREIQPHGPYRLGGWSFGGALAYETARRLSAAGETVDVLFLIDTILARKDGTDEREMLRGRFERFLDYLHETYGVRLEVDLEALVQLPEEEQINALMEKFVASGVQLSPALLEHQRTSYEDARTAEKFEPQPYDGPVILYRATDLGQQTTLDPRYARTEDALGWDAWCPRLEVVKIPGTHTSVIDPPHVDVMAQHLRHTLTEVVPHV